MPETFKTIKLILGDQLNIHHSWFQKPDPSTLFVMMEIRPESEYVTHHIQKIAGIFLAMRNFNAELEERGFHTKYFRISDPDNQHSFFDNIHFLAKKYRADEFIFQEPDEYRLDEVLQSVARKSGLAWKSVSSEHFFTERSELKDFFGEKKQPLMETFYRHLRKKYQVLMNGGDPVSGRWNYDRENRKKLPKGLHPPEPFTCEHNIVDLLDEIESAGLPYIGEVDASHFIWPTTRMEALQGYRYFLNHLLVHFGTYQDALSDEYWSLYHSRISFAMNLKLISPQEVVREAEEYWTSHQDIITLAQVEGFIRQILGWREYMRGIYWWHMPEYAKLNFFESTRSLPKYYWTGKTSMNCISRAVKQSLHYGYAHHIQRLMVTGNFCLLAGIHPDEVDEWYLGIYTDAFEWVEITNTRGMSQYADGGVVGTKPYVSSASYIHKMGDHCKSCHYDHRKKYGEKACPFNSLYWNFLDLHRDKLENNPRMSMMYRVWDKMSPEDKGHLLQQANSYLESYETL